MSIIIEDTVVCHDCGCTIDREDAVIHGEGEGERFFCVHCGRSWTTCSDCGGAVRWSEGMESNRGFICGLCRNDHYTRCYECGTLIHDDDLLESDDGHSRCLSCHNEYIENHTQGVLEYHDFEASRYRARRCDGESAKDDPILMGVELECDNGNFDIDAFERWTADDDLMHFEHDGSLSDDGVEAITMPCSLKFHQTEMDWDAFCRKMKRQGFVSHEADECGLHIHINRSAISQLSIIKMDVFVNRAKEFFGLVGRRFCIYGGRWMSQKQIDKTKGTYDRYHDHQDRYTVVNTTNRRTVEIRFPRGSLNPETVVGTIEMIHALVRFMEYIPITEIYQTSKNIKRFIDFCADDRYEKIFPMFKRLVHDKRWVNQIAKIYNKKTPPTTDVDGEI